MRTPNLRSSSLIPLAKFLGLLLALWIGFLLCSHFARLLLPSSLLLNRAGFSQAFYAKDGELLRLTLSSDDKYRLWTSIKDMPPEVSATVLLKEDQYFYWHLGVNPISLVRAFFSTYAGTKIIGGSTLTMQLARLRYGLRTRRITGKLEQMLVALCLEMVFSKDEILEAYLNLAPFGANVEGIGAAALIYFKKEASALSAAEARLLATLPQNPNRRSLEKVLLALPSQDSGGSTAIPLRGRRGLPFEAPHLVARLVAANTPGGRLRTSIDLSLQHLMERQIAQYLERNRGLGILNASAMLVEWPSMMARAYVGSANFWNVDIHGQVDGVMARRSPGSALKPFIYGLAIDKGLIHPGSMLKDTAIWKATYNPENFDREFMGPISASDALIRSRNTPAVALLNEVGPNRFLDMLRLSGISGLREESYYGLSLALGGVELRMEELAGLYAMLANGGQARKLRVLETRSRSEAAPQILSPEASFLVLEMLAENPRPSGGLDSEHLARRARVSWKTGTSYGFRDAWAVGVFGQYVLVVWIGDFEGRSNPAFVGRDAAGPLFFSMVDGVSQLGRLKSAPRQMQSLNVKKVRVCAVSGEFPGPHCPGLRTSWFIPGKSPIGTCTVHREIIVGEQSGKRLCARSTELGRREVFEFWPSDLLALFENAGMPRKTAPAYESQCVEGDSKGAGPKIIFPQEHVQYAMEEGKTRIPFSAVLDAGSSQLYWFVDDAFVGVAKSAETFFWEASPGEYLVRAVDEQGMANAVKLVVSTAGTEP